MACFRLDITAIAMRKGRVLKMADNNDGRKAEAISNFIDAVYAVYDAAWVLIHDCKLSEKKVFAMYKAIVGTWWMYETGEKK